MANDVSGEKGAFPVGMDLSDMPTGAPAAPIRVDRPAPPPPPLPAPDAQQAPPPLPLPATGNATPIMTGKDQINALQTGNVPGNQSTAGGYDPDNPGTVEEQIKRAAYLHSTGRPQDPAPKPGGGDGYKIDPAALAGEIKHWQDYETRAKSFAADLRGAANLAKPPAPDPKSIEQARAATDSLNVAAQHADRMSRFADAVVKNLQKTKNNYELAESANAENLRRNQT